MLFHKPAAPAKAIRPFWQRFVFWALAALLMFFATPQLATAGDTVVVSTAGGSQRRSGEVLDYTGRSLTLKLAGGREESIPADHVLAVETERLPEHKQGDALLAERKFADALAQYRLAGAKE